MNDDEIEMEQHNSDEVHIQDNNDNVKINPPKIHFNEEINYNKNEDSANRWLPRGENIPSSIYLLFDDPSSSTLSFIVSISVMFLILLSCIGFILSSLPKFKYPNYGDQEGDAAPLFEDIEFYCMIAFIIEYFMRFFCAPFVNWEIISERDLELVIPKNGPILMTLKKMHYFIFKSFNLIDLLAIAPFIIGVISSGGEKTNSSFGILRVLRIFRGFRVFKLGKYSQDAHIYISVLTSSFAALSLMFFFSFVTSIVFGSLVYYAEKGTWNEDLQYYERVTADGVTLERSPFRSILTGMWWVFATTTTVGYGDVAPTTAFGQIIGVFTMNLGILGLALPVTVIGANFSRIFLHQEDMARFNDNRKSASQIKHEETYKIGEIKKTVTQLHEHLKFLTLMLEAQEERLKLIP